MDARGLVNAMIAFYVDHPDTRGEHFTTDQAVRASLKQAGMGDMLVHAASLAWGVDEDTAVSVLADRMEDIRASRG